jgi:hypothetical protein
MSALLGYVPRLFREEIPTMARAFIGSTECRVNVDKDLGDTWAVSVVAPTGAGNPTAPIVVKLQGADKEKATKGALEILQKAGRIDRFDL